MLVKIAPTGSEYMMMSIETNKHCGVVMRMYSLLDKRSRFHGWAIFRHGALSKISIKLWASLINRGRDNLHDTNSKVKCPAACLSNWWNKTTFCAIMMLQNHYYEMCENNCTCRRRQPRRIFEWNCPQLWWALSSTWVASVVFKLTFNPQIDWHLVCRLTSKTYLDGWMDEPFFFNQFNKYQNWENLWFRPAHMII